MKTADANAEITAAMIAALERNIIPWQCPWRSGAPTSLWSGKPYRGINTLILGLAAQVKGYTSPWWGTFERLAELSGCEKVPKASGKGHWWRSPDGQDRGVRKGEHAVVVYFWRHVVTPDPDFPDDRDKDIHKLFCTAKRVFNLDQASFPDGIPDKYSLALAGIPELPEPEKILSGYLSREGITLLTGGAAFYYPPLDELTLPPRGMFGSAEAYYSVAYHEAAHSTGHSGRLKRSGIDEVDHFGSGKYGREELIAEMAAAMLCALTGVEGVFDNSVAYVSSWLKTIKGDPSMIRSAATAAQKAVDLIMDIHPYEEDE
jgi:antirestriction protein ArdC